MAYDTQQKYDFMNGRDVSQSFSDPSHNSEIRFEEFEEIVNEVKRVEKELIKQARNNEKNPIAVEGDLDSAKIADNLLKGQSWDEFKNKFKEEI